MKKKSLLSLLLSGLMIFTSICPASASPSESNDIYKVTSTSGASSNTIHQTGTDFYYQTPQTAYLTPLANGNYERLEYIDENIICETYDSSFKLLKTRKIPFELQN